MSSKVEKYIKDKEFNTSDCKAAVKSAIQQLHDDNGWNMEDAISFVDDIVCGVYCEYGC